MHPLLAALIPTLLLGFSILFLIIRLQNKNQRIADLEAKLREPTPKIIRRDNTTQAPFQKDAAKEAELKPEPESEKKYRLWPILMPPTPFWPRSPTN